MATKILGGLAAALLVVTVGVYAAGTGSISSMFSSEGCDHVCPLTGKVISSGSTCETAPSSCCDMSAATACAGAADETQITTAETPVTGETAPKKACCSEK